MKKDRLKAIVGPADARMASVASVAGMPIGTLPLGHADFNGRAWGLNIITGDDIDGMLAVMGAWSVTFPDARVPPPMLENWSKHERSHV